MIRFSSSHRASSLAIVLALGIAACSQPATKTQSADNQSAPERAVKETAPSSGGAALPPGNDFASLAALPDLSGPWSLDPAADAAHSKDPIPFAPPYAAKLAAVRRTAASGKPVPLVQARCVPNGMPTMMYLPGASYQFLLTPGRFTVISDTHEVRRAYTDGRNHTSDPDDSYGGEGVANWEKGTDGAADTLVVDTVGLLPELPLVPGVAGAGKVHVVERIHLVSDDKLQIDTTLTDDSLTAPYSYTRTYTRHRGASMEENICLPEPDLKL